MTKIYARTENGATTHVDIESGRSEINTAMMGGKSDVREMSQITRTDFAIEYKDGRSVRLILVDAPAPAETDSRDRRITEINGKPYVIDSIIPEQKDRRKIGDHSYSLPHPAYVHYWSARNGEAFGPIRDASARSKPGTVGRAIWDAAQ